MLGLYGKVPNTSAGSWLQIYMILFTKDYFPIISSLLSVPNFPDMIDLKFLFLYGLVVFLQVLERVKVCESGPFLM
jgi:hypothetical protein